MSCGGFVRGRAGQVISFHPERSEPSVVVGRVEVTDRSSKRRIEVRHLSEEKLRRGWTLDEDEDYEVVLVRNPSSVDLEVIINLDGGEVDRDRCPGDQETAGPWSVRGA